MLIRHFRKTKIGCFPLFEIAILNSADTNLILLQNTRVTFHGQLLKIKEGKKKGHIPVQNRIFRT